MKKFFHKITALALYSLPATALAQISSNYGLSNSEFGNTGLGEKDLLATIAQLINVILGFLGVVAVIIILMAGFKWMTAAGNEEKVDEAKKLLSAGIIGLVIILSAFAIATFIITNLKTATVGG